MTALDQHTDRLAAVDHVTGPDRLGCLGESPQGLRIGPDVSGLAQKLLERMRDVVTPVAHGRGGLISPDGEAGAFGDRSDGRLRGRPYGLGARSRSSNACEPGPSSGTATAHHRL